jgi:cytochrome c-L
MRGQGIAPPPHPRFSIFVLSLTDMISRSLWLVAALAPALLGSGAGLTGAAPPEFRSALTNAPLDLALRPGDQLSEGLKQFYASGRNPYVGRAEALARGKELYEEICQACHLPDGSGRIGPSLIDDLYINPRANTDVGMFEILFGGAFGAMRSVYDRMSQDEMLKVLAYVRTLKK